MNDDKPLIFDVDPDLSSFAVGSRKLSETVSEIKILREVLDMEPIEDETFNNIGFEFFMLICTLDCTELSWALDFVKLGSILLVCRRSLEDVLLGLGDCFRVVAEVITGLEFSTTEGVGFIRIVEEVIFELAVLDSNNGLCDDFIRLDVFEFSIKDEVA